MSTVTLTIHIKPYIPAKNHQLNKFLGSLHFKHFFSFIFFKKIKEIIF
jgi:hypothetical protein